MNHPSSSTSPCVTGFPELLDKLGEPTVIEDPSTRAQGEDLGTIQTATMFEVDVFQRCGAVAQLRHTQTTGELAVLSGCPLLID